MYTSTHTPLSHSLSLSSVHLFSLSLSSLSREPVIRKHEASTNDLSRSPFQVPCIYVNLSLPVSLPSFQFAVYRENRFHLFAKGVCLIHICDLRTGRDQAIHSVGNASEAVLCMLLRELHVPECSAGKFIWPGFEIASLGLLAAPPPKRQQVHCSAWSWAGEPEYPYFPYPLLLFCWAAKTRFSLFSKASGVPPLFPYCLSTVFKELESNT